MSDMRETAGSRSCPQEVSVPRNGFARAGFEIKGWFPLQDVVGFECQETLAPDFSFGIVPDVRL